MSIKNLKIWISRSFFSLEFECISSSSWQSFFRYKALVGNHFLRYRTLVGSLFSKIVSSSWQFFFKIRSFSWQFFSKIRRPFWKSCRPLTKWIMLREFTFRGHPHKISNFLGPFLTYLPISNFPLIQSHFYQCYIDNICFSLTYLPAQISEIICGWPLTYVLCMINYIP